MLCIIFQNSCNAQYPGKYDLHIGYFTDVIPNLINMKFPCN